MSDFQLVEPKGWEFDLHSVYSAWVGHFQVQNIPWYERSWGHLFSSFSAFLEFGWPAIVITDARTGKAHVVTRQSSIEAFLKMVKTRFGEVLSIPPNSLTVLPFETSSRPLRKISDFSSYKKLQSTIAAVELTALRTRVSKEANVDDIRRLWNGRDKTWLAMSFEWSERNEKSILEWGYAAVRCSYLDRQGKWPPEPDANYRKGHYAVSEYAEVVNKHVPNHPWEYAFGDTQILRKSHLIQVIEAVTGSLMTPDSESTANELVLVGYGIHSDLKRLEELGIKLPRNVLIVDIALFERGLFNAGARGRMSSPKEPGKLRLPNQTLSFETLLVSLLLLPSPHPQTLPPPPHGFIRLPMLPGCRVHNAGNDAFLSLFALQKLISPEGVGLPCVKRIGGNRPIFGVVPMNIPVPFPAMPHRHSANGGYSPGLKPPLTPNTPPTEFGMMGPKFEQRPQTRSMSNLLPSKHDEIRKDPEQNGSSSSGVDQLSASFSKAFKS